MQNLSSGQKDFSPLFTGYDATYVVVDHVDGSFLVRTNKNAPKYRLVAVSPDNPKMENWKEIIPEKDDVLTSVSTGGGKLFAGYLKNATTRIYQYDNDGANEKEISLPAIGSAGMRSGKREDASLFYSFTSFTYPPTIFSYDIATGTSTPFFQPKLTFSPEDYETKQVFYPSKDGTQIPMFIVHKKGMKLDGKRPTYLTAYGGFNISRTPSFSASNLILLENGGVYVLANLRGGGEYGEEWHKAGMRFNKQNVFDDFIAAGEYLIKNSYTNADRLAIAGGSNGGLLIGAVMNQRPEMFGVAFPAVGVMDMLRYHKFTIGWAWITEYGCSDSTEKDFKNLYGYSPIHNLKAGTEYPATMVTTADHDDRVVPAHSFKYAATLQEMHAGKAPVLIRIQTDAGHGGGKPISKIIEEQADKWGFMFYNMGLTIDY